MVDNIYDDPEKILKADDATMTVLDNFRRSKNSLVDKMRDKWSEWYKAYRAAVEVDDDDVRSNLVIAIIFSHIEAYLPRLVANRPRIEAWGREPGDGTRAWQHRHLLIYDWDLMEMAFKIINFVKSAEIFGTAWFKIYHKQERRTRLVKRMMLEPKMFGPFQIGEEAVQMEVEEPIITWDDPQVDFLEVDQVYPDPDGFDENSCRWLIHRYPVDIDHLKLSLRSNGEPLYDQTAVRKLEDLAKHGNPEGYDMEDSVKREREETFGAEMSPLMDVHKRRFWLLEQWSDDKVMVVAEGFPDVKPLRNERNPYGIKPFSRFTPCPDPNAVYGISVAEMLYAVQLELSTLHNVRMDHIIQGAHQMHTILRTANLNPKQVRWRPGGHIYVNDHNDIRPLDTKPLEFAAYRESDNLMLLGQQISGATDTFQGLSTSQTGGTATEAAILQQASASRAGLMFQILGTQTLNRLGKILARINEYHITDERVVRILGDQYAQEQFVRVTPEELTSGSGIDLDIVIDIAQTEPANKAFRRKERLEALQTVGAIYQDPNHPVMQRLIADLLETHDIREPMQLAQQPAQIPGPQGSQPAPSGVRTTGDALAATGGAGV